jgi:hypothetical protein
MITSDFIRLTSSSGVLFKTLRGCSKPRSIGHLVCCASLRLMVAAESYESIVRRCFMKILELMLGPQLVLCTIEPAVLVHEP